ncbi:MAG: hypothetical protein WCI45_06425, partial [Desulfuromonadales bacterium]
MNSNNKTVVSIAVLVGLITLAVYSGSLTCGFINMDDPFYITNNLLIRNLDLQTLRRLFTEAHLGAWIPLTHVSFAIDHHFWGSDPTGYHLTNIVLHALNATMVVLLTDRLLKNERKWIAGDIGNFLYPVMLLLAGLMWGIHPLRVESVAWAAERKDVLNGLLTLAAVISYIRYVQLKEAGKRRMLLVPYLLALLFFVLSLLAKQVSVTLPVILLLLDWYPLARFRKKKLVSLLVEKIPFLVIALLIAFMTIYIAAEGKILSSIVDFPFYVRVLVSGNAIFEYCRLSFFPTGINPYIVIPKPLPYGYLVKTITVAAISLFMLRISQRKPAIAAVWFAFIVLLLPTLAFIQAGDDIAMAARYT